MLKNIFRGIRAYSGAFALISKLGLWKYFGIPILISILTFTLIGFLAYGLSDNIGAWIAGIWVWEWGAETFRTISEIIGALLIVTIGLILYKNIILALSAPFMGPVSERIESHLSGKPIDEGKNKFFRLLFRGIKVNGRNLVMELFLSIPIFILSFVPVINFLSPVLLFLVQSYYAGFGNMDYTLERHFDYSKSIKFVSDHRGIAIGNGMIFILMLFIPLIGIIFVLPLSVTAATTETTKLLYPQSRHER